MSRARYQCTEEDVPVVHRWVHGKLRDTTWPQPDAAHTARAQFPREQPTAAQLAQWCDQYLDVPQWAQLQAVIRSARRDVAQTRTVRLSPSAHQRLQALATREQLTLSEAIERYLMDAVAAPTPPEAPPVPAPPAAAPARGKAAVQPPQKRGSAFVTTKKGVCYLTVKEGRYQHTLMRIYHYTIDAQDKRDMRRLHPDVLFDWKKITRQLAEKREICRRYRSRRRTPRVPREREPFYGVYEPQTRRVYVNDPDNIAGVGALLDALVAGGLPAPREPLDP
ncbi:MAG: hypothetical protein AB7N91_07775 [Candidatus Tectimicrobiota bacterium]